MRRIGLAVVLALSLFVALLAAKAQQTTKVTPIGYLRVRGKIPSWNGSSVQYAASVWTMSSSSASGTCAES